jgi:hypothetical protein
MQMRYVWFGRLYVFLFFVNLPYTDSVSACALCVIGFTQHLNKFPLADGFHQAVGTLTEFKFKQPSLAAVLARH